MMKKTPLTVNSNIFPSNYHDFTLYVPVGSGNTYRITDVWNYFGRIIESNECSEDDPGEDLTDQYITNPRFDNNDVTTGWSGTKFTTNKTSENAEHYYWTFDSYQTITGLTPGKYRVSVQAFFRAGSAENDYDIWLSGSDSGKKVLLYATSTVESKDTAICQAASGTTDIGLGGSCSINGYGYIPNDMVAASAWFKAGYYNNSVEVLVGDDGKLTIGIRKNTIVVNSMSASDWVCLDNWKLEKIDSGDAPGNDPGEDLTNQYITNPRFDNNDVTTGWSGTKFTTNKTSENAEHYNCTFDSYQTITGLTPGKYRVSVQAFFRAGSAENDYDVWSSGSDSGKKVLLYATSTVESKNTAICQAASGTTDIGLGGSCSNNGYGYIPNDMVAASAWFKAGYYNNSVKVLVGDDGKLTIGIRKNTMVVNSMSAGDWVCLDNWKLEKIEGKHILAEDVNKDGSVDTQDVLDVYNFIREGGVTNSQDVNKDGTVDTQDVLMIYDYVKAHAKARK